MEETTKHVFTREEVAMILAHYISRTEGDLIVNPRLEIGHDIILVSDVVE